MQTPEALASQLLQNAGFGAADFAPTPLGKDGDRSTALALRLAKERNTSPMQLAEEMATLLEQNAECAALATVSVAKPGFLNLHLKSEYISAALWRLDIKQACQSPAPRRLVLDFSHPNIAKPLHFGHLRSTILGESLRRLLTFCGHEVLADNFLGDFGTQFGKLIVGIREFGNQANIKQDPLPELLQIYQRFHQAAEHDEALTERASEAFRALESGEDPKGRELWEQIRGWTLDGLKPVYKRLGAHFDVIRGEAFYESHLAAALEKLVQSGVGKEEESGAIAVDFGEESGLPSLIFRRSDGATLYQTRDLARIFFYAAEGVDELINIVGADQSLYFRQVFAAARACGADIQEMRHVSYGMVRLPEGKMSTRSGRSIGLVEVLDMAEEKMAAELDARESAVTGQERQQLIRQLAMGAVKMNDLQRARQTDVVFEWDKMLSFSGFSGPGIVYAAVRCGGILQGGAAAGVQPAAGLLAEEELPLAKKILGFSAAVQRSVDALEPHHLCRFLFEMATELHRFYANCPVQRGGEAAPRRALLVQKTQLVLKQGLDLLGIEVPDRM